MRVITVKSVFVLMLIVLSALCFIYVNTANVIEPTMTQANLKVENKAVQDTRMPDLKLIKSVMDVIGKFMTAK
jgi:hypothetical protein